MKEKDPRDTGLRVRERRKETSRTYASHIAAGERRLTHLQDRLRDHGKSYTSKSFDRGEALFIEEALNALRRTRAEYYSGQNALDLLRDALVELEPDGDIAMRIARFLEDVEEKIKS